MTIVVVVVALVVVVITEFLVAVANIKFSDNKIITITW
jgi:hypothetical protein